MKFFNLKIILMLFIVSVALAAAQPPQPGSIPPPVGVPVNIDNIKWLFLSGIFLGGFLMLKKKR
jgi:formate hydrogenlyase subunit 3/multisubunit Na+/H+ antiporter MnhD subunit